MQPQQPQQPPDPQDGIKLSEEEIRAMSASLRSTTNRKSTPARAASGMFKGIIGMVRLPLTIASALAVFIITGSFEEISFLGRLGAALVGLVVAYLFTGYLQTWFGRRRFRVD